MALTIGIVGLPNVGKPTLFSALTCNDVLAANYPFATIEPNIGVVGVSGSRLPVLAKMLDSQRTVPVITSFMDIAGIVRGVSKGEGMGSVFLVNIREADAICQITRVFEDVDVTHVGGKVDPAGDIGTVTTELILTGLQSLEKTLPRAGKEARIKRGSRPKLETVRAAVEILEFGKRIHGLGLDMELLRDLFLLTTRSLLYVFNYNQDELADEDLRDRMCQIVVPAKAVLLDAKFEAELVETDEEESHALLGEMGVMESGLDVLARVGYETLGLQSYLTADPEKARIWTIPQGATAPETAGMIHTDFQKGFIKAQVVNFDGLVAVDSEAAAKVVGKIRLEGGDYVIQDDDVVEFRTGLASKR